jgi:hypothetical protein
MGREIGSRVRFRPETPKFDPKRRFEDAAKHATIREDGVTVLPPGIAEGAHDVSDWAKRRNAGFAGVHAPNPPKRWKKRSKLAALDKAAAKAAKAEKSQWRP